MSAHSVPKALIAEFRALRDKKKEITDRHKEELAPLNERMAKIESGMRMYLLKIGDGDDKAHLATSAGTAYLSTTTRSKIDDWPVFKKFMLDEGMVDMVEHRVSNEAVTSYMEANDGALPPGVSISQDINCRFKK